MKATEIKYLLLLHGLAHSSHPTHTELASTLDVPPSLVNRYLKRLARWDAVRIPDQAKGKYEVTPKGEALLARASWEFLAFGAGLVEQLHRRAVTELQLQNVRKAVLYGATPLARIIERWATEAGIDVVAVCDEERHGRDVARLDDLKTLEYDAIILTDWERAEDKMLARLLRQFGPVINPFNIDGTAKPEWR